jgi:predicted extracellular nuclease
MPSPVTVSALRRLTAVVVLLGAAAALATGPIGAQAPASALVISQVYGGGGNTGAPYTHDFIEIFNRGAVPVSLAGHSLQYASATGTGNFGASATQLTELPDVTLLPGQYFLVQEASSSVGAPLPTPDLVDTTPIAMAAGAGKVALVTGMASLGCNGGSTACSAAQLALIVDLVGYGSANFFEGTAAPTLSNTTAGLRRSNGCTDSNDNGADFQALAPAPRTTASPFAPCSAGTPTNPAGVGVATPSSAFPGATTLLTVAVTPGANPTSTGLTVVADLSAIGGGASVPLSDAGTNGDVTAGDDVFSLAVTVAPTATSGPRALPFAIADAQARSATGTIAFTVQGCTPTHTIAQVQGSGGLSPLAGQVVTVRGVVTAVRSSGFYVQTPDAEVDGDPATSEGVLVFTSSAPPAAAAVGHAVCVTAGVTEFVPTADPTSPSLTELVRSAAGVLTVVALSAGNPLPTPVVLSAAATVAPTAVSYLEALEGMRVSAPRLVATGPTLGSITEPTAAVSSSGVFYAVLDGVARPFREAGVDVNDPLPTCAAGVGCTVPIFDGNPERIRVDSDALGAPALNVASGAVIDGLVGPLDYGFRTYTLLPEAAPTAVQDTRTATAVPTAGPGEIAVASLNVQRFFDTTNDPSIGEPVLTPAAFDGRLGKASLVIRQQLGTPDIVALIEVENVATLQALAARIDADAAAGGGAVPAYAAYLEEGNDPGGIDVGFLVRGGQVDVLSVTQEGKDATFINPDDGQPDLLNDRPPLLLRAQAVRPIGQPFEFVVIVNHLRSLNDADTPRVRAKRAAQAEFLAGIVQRLQAAGDKVLLVGDFNAFEVNDGYVDVLGAVVGTPAAPTDVVTASPDLVDPDLVNLQTLLPPAERYSYIFDGNAQTLDHALANQALLPWVARFGYARGNADFPQVLYADPSRPERLSDHDASVTALALGAPRLSTAVTGVTGGPGGLTVQLAITNGGEGTAFGVTIDHVVLQTTLRQDAVTLASPGLPIALGRIAPGQTVVVPLQLATPAGGLGKLGVIAQGTLTRPDGASIRYTTKAQALP